MKLALLGTHDADIDAAQAAIDRGVERIDKNISLVSEISKGSVTDKTQCDLAELVREATSWYEPKAAAAGIRLETKTPQKQPALMNQLAVNSVLVNYLRNALDSLVSTHGTTISVTLSRRAKQHYIEVADDGDGVADDIQPQLFKTFATKKTGGMGVGLYYCKTIVESHGGTVGFESKRPRGARFWATFPAEG
jgi:signal transduction histidine kinase